MTRNHAFRIVSYRRPPSGSVTHCFDNMTCQGRIQDSPLVVLRQTSRREHQPKIFVRFSKNKCLEIKDILDGAKHFFSKYPTSNHIFFEKNLRIIKNGFCIEVVITHPNIRMQYHRKDNCRTKTLSMISMCAN